MSHYVMLCLEDSERASDTYEDRAEQSRTEEQLVFVHSLAACSRHYVGSSVVYNLSLS